MIYRQSYGPMAEYSGDILPREDAWARYLGDAEAQRKEAQGKEPLQPERLKRGRHAAEIPLARPDDVAAAAEPPMSERLETDDLGGAGERRMRELGHGSVTGELYERMNDMRKGQSPLELWLDEFLGRGDARFKLDTEAWLGKAHRL